MKRLFVVFFLVFFTLGLVGCDLFGGATTSQVVTTETSTTITEQTTTETSDLTLRLMQIYELALEAEAFSGTYEEWLETVRGPEGAPGADGQEVLMQVASGYIQWKHEGDTTWTNLIALTALAGADGIDGKELTLQVAEGKIQWQYVGDTTWSDLIDLSVITGADGIDGKEVAFQVLDGHIQWQYVGETSWVDLVDLVTLTGEAGTNGKEVVMQVSGGYVQWQYVGDTTWTNLISIATITGADGIDGTNGVDGKEVILQVTDEYIQWQYVGDTTWTNLIALSTLTGADGLDGTNGTDGREVTFQVADDYIKWQYVGDTTWTNLISIATITGADGIDGTNGVDGKEVILQVTDDYIQWQYVGDTTWTNLIALSTLTGADGLDGTNGTDGREVTFQVADDYIKWQYVGDTTWTNLISIATITGADGIPVTLRVDSDYIQWQYVGDTTWTNLIALSTLTGADGLDGTNGTDGREVTFQVADDYIKWQYVGDATWTNLISIATITGADGIPVTLRVDSDYIQWQYVGDTTWTDLIALSDLTGAAGSDGKEVEMQLADGYIQWHYVGETTWLNLVSVASITGADGIDGKEVTFQTSTTHIQWQYVGDTVWTDLIELATLIGPQGVQGVGISSAVVNEIGELVITYTDATVVNLGQLLKVCQVVYKDYNGYILSVQHVLSGNNAVVPTDPSRGGYDFSGWDQASTDIVADLEINATYAKQAYTVNFYAYDGTLLKTESVLYLDGATAPVAPSITGKTFVGWSEDYAAVDANLDIDAEYETNTYHVDFYDYNGSLMSAQVVVHGGSAIAPESPAREGYDFLGWDQPYLNITTDLAIYATYTLETYAITYYDREYAIISTESVERGQDGTPPVAPAIEGYRFIGWDKPVEHVMYDLDVIALYEIIVYEVVFRNYDGSIFDIQHVQHGSDASDPGSPTKVGWSFTGWNQTYISVTEDLDIAPVFSQLSYQVDFYDELGNLVDSQTVLHGEDAVDPYPTTPSLIKTGYEFVGWDETLKNVTANLTCHPIYEIITYEVTFVDDNYHVFDVQTINHGSTAYSPLTPSKTGYDFVGWDTDFSSVTADLIVMATYEIRSFVVDFYDAQSNLLVSESVNYMDSATEPMAPIIIGYDFVSWDKDFSQVTSSMSIYPIYQIKTYEVVFHDNDGAILSSQTIYHGDDAVAPTDMDLFGYTFNGWDTIYTDVVCDLEVHPLYTVNEYSVVFEENGGSSVTDRSNVTHGSTISLEIPVQLGYRFTGWYFGDTENDAKFYATTPVTGDLTLYARWELASYDVIFYDYDDTILRKSLIGHGYTAIAPDDPSRVGYTFEGWDTSFHVVVTDLSIHPIYIAIDYPLTVDENGGTYVPDMLIAYDTSIPLLVEPSRNGYTFVGWFKDSLLTIPFVNDGSTELMPLNGLSIYANWDINQYTMSFEENGGSTIDDITLDYNTVIQEPTEPTRTGYTFKGWFSDPDFSTEYEFTNMPAENITLYAKWQINEYEVYYFAENVNLSEPGLINIDTNDFFVQISGGGDHTIALTNEGRVFTWGYNNWRQLGDGTVLTRTSPVEITANLPLNTGEKVVVVGAGSLHTVVLTSEGRIFTWGNNDYGQLGNDQTSWITINDITARFDLGSEERVIKLSVGDYHSGVITSAGRVFVWGSNSYGKLGDGTAINSLVPIEITQQFSLTGDEIISSLALGAVHSAAVTSYGRVFTWGYNNYGQLGDGLTTSLASPTEITSNFGLAIDEYVTDIDVNGNFSLAITSDNRIFTWGLNSEYQLGDGTNISKLLPNEITHMFDLAEGETFASASLGTIFAGVSTSLERVFTWGYNGYSQLGTGTTLSGHSPFEITGNFNMSCEDEGVVEVSMGASHSTALTSSGQIHVWGKNFYGQLGIGTTTISAYPVQPKLYHSMLLEKFEVYAYNATLTEYIPTRTGYSFDQWYTDVAMTNPYVFSTMPADDVYLYSEWIVNSYTISFEENGGSEVVDITQDYKTTVVAPTEPTRTAYTFIGWFADIDLTVPYTFSTMPAENITLYAKWTNVPYTISFEENGGSEVTDITAFYNEPVDAPADPTREGYTFMGWFADAGLTTPYEFTTMPLDGTTVYADWEINQYSLSFNAIEEYLNPQFENGANHSLLLTQDNRLYAVGYNIYGQLGNGTLTNTTTKIDITDFLGLGELESIQKIVAAYHSSFVLTTDGRLLVTGINSDGQLGIGDLVNRNVFCDITANFNLATGETITNVFSGGLVTFVLTSEGRIFGFGDNYVGSVGDGTSNNDRTLPVDITANFDLEIGETITSVEIGYYHAYAITSNHRVFSWGRNTYGQLGIGSSADQSLPIDITANFPLEVDDSITMVSAGLDFGIALSESGRVFTWGYNYYGMLGVNYTGNIYSPR
ncbi:MAG: InlB B-repeat-containing protein, partial [Bacilli bacterium]|nr:InlB B-repeat-containing protein [Bacilli bacterium]